MSKPELQNWDKSSHKGQHGKVLVVGGSNKYYGAPILTALGAERAGADLITLFLPKEFAATARNYSLNFFINEFVEDILTLADCQNILAAAHDADCLVIGNGIGKDHATQNAVIKILSSLEIPAVIDAEALSAEILEIPEKHSDWVITPHSREFKRVFTAEKNIDYIKSISNQYDFTICLKGPEDIIAKAGNVYVNNTGAPQMRIGGTGDVLAGIIGSYIAQGDTYYQACINACHYYGKCGESLAQKQRNFSAQQLIDYFPIFLKC